MKGIIMGMYTEFHFNSKLQEEVPQEVIHILYYMLSSEVEDAVPVVPEHPLFDTTRWPVMLRMSSYYFDADTNSTLRFDDIAEQYYICIRCNLKNYDSEIEKFIDWIDPYLDKYEGEFLGFYRYEETEVPTLIYKK
jgi:hypothetical protein